MERIWHYNEPFHQYFQNKLMLSNNLNIREEELIKDIIDGFNNQILQTQAKIQRFRTTSELLEAFQNISNVINSTFRRPTTISNNHQQIVLPTKPVKCFNCNRFGHDTGECKLPKREKGSCFICGKFEHLSFNCPQKKDKQVMFVEEEQNNFEKNLVFDIKGENSAFLNIELLSLLDTGAVQ